MKHPGKLTAIVLGTVLVVGLLSLGERLSIAGLSGFVSQASAEVGRPLSPVSVAGVARRSNR